MGDATSRRFMVGGLVQGVGFRWTAQNVARALGITGTVRNRPDGSVEIEAHGAPEALDGLARALHTRMPGRVDSVHEDRLESAGEGRTSDDFRIVF